MLMECVWYGYFTNYLESVEELRKGLVPNRSEWDINLSQEISTGYPFSTKSTVRIHYFDLCFVSLKKCMMFSISFRIPCEQNHLMIKLEALKGHFHILYCKK